VSEEIECLLDDYEYRGKKVPDDWRYAEMLREKWIAAGQPATGTETDEMVWTYVLTRWQLDEGTAKRFLYAARQYSDNHTSDLNDQELDLMARLVTGWTGTTEDLIMTTLRLVVEPDWD